jgi:hypothetical protein
MSQVAKMTNLDLPEDTPEGLELELYKGRWAVKINGNLYVFPQETTKAQAEEVLVRASTLHRTRKN